MASSGRSASGLRRSPSPRHQPFSPVPSHCRPAPKTARRCKTQVTPPSSPEGHFPVSVASDPQIRRNPNHLCPQSSSNGGGLCVPAVSSDTITHHQSEGSQGRTNRHSAAEADSRSLRHHAGQCSTKPPSVRPVIAQGRPRERYKLSLHGPCARGRAGGHALARHPTGHFPPHSETPEPS